MTDYIGARLSLVSKSDIRYVGILHEIDSANSTVSLEQVRSFGTEGRKGDPALEIPASDNVFEYIIFRGSDVKDLRVEQGATAQPPAPRQVPQDPAIINAGPPPPAPHERQQQYSQGPPRGFDGPQYGAPPPQHYGYGYPPPPHQQQHHQHQQQQFMAAPPSQQAYGYPPQGVPQPSFQQQDKSPFAPQPQNAFPDMPSESASQAPVTQSSQKKAPVKTEGEKNTQAKIVPALPLPGHAASPRPKANREVSDVTRGMDKLSTSTPPPSTNGQPKRNALLEVPRNMKAPVPATPAPTPAPAPAQASPDVVAQPSRATGPPASEAPSRGGRRDSTSGRRDPGIRQNGVIVNPEASIVIPTDEYDFLSANAKFSKEGLNSEKPIVPVYDKKSSFFDSISSEATDRTEGGSGGRGRGREVRVQERTMNYETFGEDLAFRNNRGRGRGGRGRGRGRGRPSQSTQ